MPFLVVGIVSKTRQEQNQSLATVKFNVNHLCYLLSLVLVVALHFLKSQQLRSLILLNYEKH